ncbi:MAG: hypothetical protein RM347_005465 [Nostoc sp. ChiQUE02]|uniref:hypothetical protein n=1 Tax=Nostoc sp. ChiQUE02 TaxID=3075377 RepID=UPI002AD3F902|nr:hypothetical protein [Nostoc sp. ChiQUE02]MDZ8231173.1 hypothetical protein [Nostoc sp. ChiQUE02]
MKILDHKDPINHDKDAINRRQDERLIIVETAIHRVPCLNRTVLALFLTPSSVKSKILTWYKI